MNFNDGGAGARAAANATLQATNNEILGECKKNKKGEFCARYSSIVRGLLNFGVGLMYFCILLMFLYCYYNKFENKERVEDLVHYSMSVLGVSLFMYIILKKMMFYKYTLTNNETVIKKVFSKERIPYNEFTKVINKFPPLQYRGHMVFMTENKIFKFEYSGIVGRINFLKLFYEKIGYAMTEEECIYLVKKVKGVYVRGATKEEKRKYKEYKGYLANKL